jgi:hypothetical protein
MEHLSVTRIEEAHINRLHGIMILRSTSPLTSRKHILLQARASILEMFLGFQHKKGIWKLHERQSNQFGKNPDGEARCHYQSVKILFISSGPLALFSADQRLQDSLN